MCSQMRREVAVLSGINCVSRFRAGISVALVAIFAWACSGPEDHPENALFRWSIATVVEIDAPPERVWEVLIDLPAYPEWNPFIVAASGKVAVGETLSLSMVLPGYDPITISPRLLIVEPGRELRWKGRLVLPGLFDGEHAFILTPLADGRTRVDHTESFAGLLLPVLRSFIFDATVEAFHKLDAALAKRAAIGDRDNG
jgi:hypothetical protein